VWFEANPGKQFARPYLEKNPSQKRTDGVAQGVSPAFKPQHHKRKRGSDKINLSQVTDWSLSEKCQLNSSLMVSAAAC
jgi:hypothetical protein